MSGTCSTYTPPKMGVFKPIVCSTPSSSNLPAETSMTPEEAEEVCNQLAKEYKEFLVNATAKFQKLSADRKAVSASLASAKAEREMLIAKIETRDLAIAKKQEELIAKDKVIAATRETLVGEMKNVSSLQQVAGVEKIELERTVVREVVKKLNEVLSLLGVTQGSGAKTEQPKNENLQVDVELGKSVLSIVEVVYKDNKGLVKMFGNPNEKLFGWIGDVFYPIPMKEFNDNVLGYPMDTSCVRNQVPGRPTVVKTMPLTTNGSSISMREYKTIHDMGLKVMGDFAKAVLKKSRDRLEMEGSLFLTATTNTDFQGFVDNVIRGFIPPKLRGFFTNPQAKEEYVKVTRDGITALLAGIFNKATADLQLNSDMDTSLKSVFMKQVFAAIAGKCQTQKTRDLCQEAVARVNEELGIVLRVKGTRKLLTLAAQKATRGVVDEIRLMAVLNEAYQPTGTSPEPEPFPEDGEDTVEPESRGLRKRKTGELANNGNDAPATKRVKGPGTGSTNRGARGRGIGGRAGSRGKRGRKVTSVLSKKARNSKVGYQEVDEPSEEVGGKKKTKSVVTKEMPKFKNMRKSGSRKVKESTKKKDFEDEEPEENEEEDGTRVGITKRFVSVFGSHQEEEEEEEEEEVEKEEDGGQDEEEDVTLVDEIIKLEPKPKSKRNAKGTPVVPRKVVPWEGNKIRGNNIGKK